ncbi:pyridoxamine 5'-phosphate oxidase family protein [Streptococcus didelphis]|uniref:Pyridoxamine 5'-phosphate oxidase family protein n=1 Tax=Streptococcus didelphis TaxID=102886 RepID=A0ABY9LHF4_9STRE|nr:pyridoxamine 5'-phosphate oxidase family protein [Streptococcus didelphis]WMB28284.1 pyridoxamine 5'-phosphate oxidase family protein [Streptococcus didelphis]WMB28957.1 pyridoxamine 5'-phosphate oxidase family protein [Streptococcus didelphis]
MFTETFYEVLKHEGPVSITSWSKNQPHVTCTWNSYLVIKDNDTILIPAAGMRSIEEDLALNDQLILTLAAREVEGYNGYQGTGFRIQGRGEFLVEGSYYDEMKAKYPFIRSVLQVNVEEAKQLL